MLRKWFPFAPMLLAFLLVGAGGCSGKGDAPQSGARPSGKPEPKPLGKPNLSPGGSSGNKNQGQASSE